MKKNFFAAFACLTVFAGFFSCENESELGSGILPGSDSATVIITDTVEVNAYTEYDDTISTLLQTYLIAGKFDDPVFGKTETSFAVQFSNVSYEEYSKGAVADSVVMTIGFDTLAQRFYGDSTEIFKLDIYPITKVLDTAETTFNATTDFSQYYSKTKIGTAEFIPANVKNTVTVYLDKQYGNDIISASKDTTFDEKICGLYFKVPDNAPNCLMRAYIPSSKSEFEYTVYYKSSADTVESSVVYSASSTDFRFGLATHDYSNCKELLDQLEGKNNDGKAENVFLQGLTGTRIRLEFPNIKNFKPAGEKPYFVLMRAQLIVPYQHDEQYAPLPYLICTGINTQGQDCFFPEFYQMSSGVRTNVYTYVTADYTEHCYRVDLTGRIKNFIDFEGDPDYSIYLRAGNRTSDFSRSVLGTYFNGNKDNRMRLIVEYLKYEK